MVRELRRKWFRMMAQNSDYGYLHAYKVMKHTASQSGILNGRTPVEFVTGDIPNIAELLDFSFL